MIRKESVYTEHYSISKKPVFGKRTAVEISRACGAHSFVPALLDYLAAECELFDRDTAVRWISSVNFGLYSQFKHNVHSLRGLRSMRDIVKVNPRRNSSMPEGFFSTVLFIEDAARAKDVGVEGIGHHLSRLCSLYIG